MTSRKGSLKEQIRQLPERMTRGKLYEAVKRIKSPVLRDSCKIIISPLMLVAFLVGVCALVVKRINTAIEGKLPTTGAERVVFFLANAVQIVAPFLITYAMLNLIGNVMVALVNACNKVFDFAFSSLLNLGVVSGLILVAFLLAFSVLQGKDEEDVKEGYRS